VIDAEDARAFAAWTTSADYSGRRKPRTARAEFLKEEARVRKIYEELVLKAVAAGSRADRLAHRHQEGHSQHRSRGPFSNATEMATAQRSLNR